MRSKKLIFEMKQKFLTVLRSKSILIQKPIPRIIRSINKKYILVLIPERFENPQYLVKSLEGSC